MKSEMPMNMKQMMTMGRNMMGMPSMAPAGMPMGTMDMMMIPRCMFKMEKCKDGMKIMCMASDEMAASMMGSGSVPPLLSPCDSYDPKCLPFSPRVLYRCPPTCSVADAAIK